MVASTAVAASTEALVVLSAVVATPAVVARAEAGDRVGEEPAFFYCIYVNQLLPILHICGRMTESMTINLDIKRPYESRADHGTYGRYIFQKPFPESLAKGHIQAYFQPVFASISGSVVSAEALARWHDPERGMLSPADFIPSLESNGLIFDLDMEILRQTCAFYREMVVRGTPVPSFSVNLSRLDFKHADDHGHEALFDTVTGILKSYDVPHDAIKLEITESLMLEDISTFQSIFQQFNDAGFSMWLDDFGSGYSSLNVLQNYNFDIIKFDMLFLRNFSAKGRQLLASLISMSKTLGIHTLVEGVETQEQQEFLRSVGCELQQGFLHFRPLSREDFIAVIDEQRFHLDSVEDSQYWRQIGNFNFLSANPLDEFAEIISPDEGHSNNMGIPLALMECSPNQAHYVYANASYVKCIHDLGYASMEDLEQTFNDRRGDQYLMLKKLVTDAIELGTRQTVEYINKDIYYRVSAQRLAKQGSRAMLAMRLATFDSEHEVDTAKEMLTYGNSLFSAYEIVVMFYPEKGISKRIYSANSIPAYGRANSLQMSLQGFAASHVSEIDRERYKLFLISKRSARASMPARRGLSRAPSG